jgi:flagella basal body P-ring formation protein FlgA
MIRALAFAAALVLAGPALAGTPVDLRASVGFSGGRLTLGDLFENAGAASRVVVASGLGANAVLDAGRVQRLALQNGLEWDNPRGFQRIIARAGAAPTASAARRGQSSVLAYARDISAGEIIQASDLIWSKEAVAPGDAPRDSDAVIGMAARRPLREGSAVARHDVAAAQVIKRDDIISVAYEADGVSLTLQAKAMQPAAAGEAFNVMNPSSKKIIQAVATGPGQAVVGPRAEQMRGAANPTLVASLR